MQAFSHYTFELTSGYKICVDVQGVGDLYTDPQVCKMCVDARGWATISNRTPGVGPFVCMCRVFHQTTDGLRVFRGVGNHWQVWACQVWNHTCVCKLALATPPMLATGLPPVAVVGWSPHFVAAS